MALGNLTTLANVKSWLGITTTNSDATITRLIAAASSQIRTLTGRYNFLPTTTTETRDGTGTQRFVFKNWPVLSVASVLVDNTTILPGNWNDTDVVFSFFGQEAGWYLHPYDGNPPGEPQTLELSGYEFCRGKQNVRITYTYGYQTVEAATVPAAPYQYAAEAPQGAWSSDQGVAYAATGLPLTAVETSPGVGQYSVTAGEYQFAAGDTGQAVVVTYGMVPYDLEQICIDLVAYKFAGASRIGVRSKSLGGQENVSYDISGIPANVAMALQPWTSVLLVP